MTVFEKASGMLNKFNGQTKLGDLRKIAAKIRKDHRLAIELYKDEMEARNCTPNDLPEFIAIEAAKRNL